MANPTSGDLRTPVTFYEQTPNGSWEPVNEPTKEVFQAWAQVYSASSKDNTILNANDYTSGVTIKIRDTQGEFVPSPTEHCVFIDDYRYKNVADWDIVDVRPDFEDDRFVVLVLSNPTLKAGGDAVVS